MTIKHHNIFKVYLPKSYTGEEEHITHEMLMEEAYLFSNGKMTPNFKPNVSELNPLDIILFPSLIFASKKLHQSESEQILHLNETIDVEFCKMVLWTKPIYRLTEFIDYHYNYCLKDKNIFLKHLKFVILPLIKKIINNDKDKQALGLIDSPEYIGVSEIIKTWIKEKDELLNPKIEMKTNTKFETNIGKANKVIVNNDGRITRKSSKENSSTKNKKTIQIIGIIISILMLAIAILTNWDKFF